MCGFKVGVLGAPRLRWLARATTCSSCGPFELPCASSSPLPPSWSKERGHQSTAGAPMAAGACPVGPASRPRAHAIAVLSGLGAASSEANVHRQWLVLCSLREKLRGPVSPHRGAPPPAPRSPPTARPPRTRHPPGRLRLIQEITLGLPHDCRITLKQPLGRPAGIVRHSESAPGWS